MPRPVIRLALAVLLAGVSLFAAQPAQSAGLSLPLLTPKPVPVVAPVAPPATEDPVGRAPVGTMIMVHAGGWAGHDQHAESLLMDRPGQLLLQRGWRVVSIDYNEGTQGLQDVLDAAGSELARGSSSGPLCIYGESAGAQLALVAAARLRAIDCVIGIGTPTDLPLYEQEAAISSDPQIRLVASQMARFFGTTNDAMAPWNPIALAPSIHADVLLIHEADDQVVSPSQSALFQQARPTTQTLELQAGDPADPSTKFVHGTVSDAGRAAYGDAIGAFADRAVAAHSAELVAVRSGCASVRRSVSEIGVSRLVSAVRCLARKDPAARHVSTRDWVRTSVAMRGEVNAARVWAFLRATKSGLRALRQAALRRAAIVVKAGARSQIVVRATV
jgi:acetyl esterase/lipase